MGYQATVRLSKILNLQCIDCIRHQVYITKPSVQRYQWPSCHYESSCNDWNEFRGSPLAHEIFGLCQFAQKKKHLTNWVITQPDTNYCKTPQEEDLEFLCENFCSSAYKMAWFDYVEVLSNGLIESNSKQITLNLTQ